MRSHALVSTVSKVRTNPHPAAATAPFFIVGSGRSGSTLLRLMLAAHSRLAIPPETWYLVPVVQRFSLDRALTPAEVESAISIITSHYRWPDMKLEGGEFRRRVGELSEPRVRDLADVVYRWHLESAGKVRWGDKTPPYIEIVPQLAKMYPDARFIHLVRDGRDVALSFRAVGWTESPWLHDNAREWIRAMECYWRWLRSGLRDRILLVRYEDLVLKTEATLRRICAFIGEEFESQMLSWERLVDEQVPRREHWHHAKLKMRIGAEGVARWKREINGRWTFVCEAFMGAHLRRLGYELRYSSPLWRPVFAVTRHCGRLIPHAFETAARLRERLGYRVGST